MCIRDSMRSELRASEINMNNKLESMNKTIAGMRGEIIININNIQDEINESRTRKEKVENNTVTSDCDKITDNQSNNKITNNYEKELTTDSSKIVENEIYKNNTVKIISDHNNIEM